MILVVDNYDSFTYNLVQLLYQVGEKVLVLRNDHESAGDMLRRGPSGILLSPGPGRPESAGVCLDLLAAAPALPILGVCLGHQSLSVAMGGDVVSADELMHGKTSEIHHRGQGLFRGMKDPFTATRYHSLVVPRENLPEDLVEEAWTEDGVLMGMRHRTRPWWGVQFHPESILTEQGDRLIENFVQLCRQTKQA